eukprot:SAG31_NODE_19833_length_590_cov_1.372709_1_plen_24_part_01
MAVPAVVGLAAHLAVWGPLGARAA